MTSPDKSPPTARPILLVVEDDPSLRSPVWAEVASAYEVHFASSAEDALAQLAQLPAALIVVDDSQGRSDRAFELREQLIARGVTTPMAFMAARGDDASAVEALRRGFVDYLVKRDGLRHDLVRRRIETNLELARLRRDNEALQKSIEESQARLFNVYDSLDDVIMQIDHDCRVVSMNRSAAALANIEPKDGVGKVCWQLWDFFPCEQRAKKEQCHIYRTFLEGETIRGERRDEKSKTVTQFMTFITTFKGNDYTVYRESDITEKRRLEEKIASALRSLGASPDGREGA